LFYPARPGSRIGVAEQSIDYRGSQIGGTMTESVAKQKALVICPGRGTYNTAELGYLAKHHGNGNATIQWLDRLRQDMGQTTLSELDSAPKFVPSLHLTGDNASLLIYACALADFAAIDRDKYDVVAVAGNSMGWYLALACADVLNFDAGARLVNNMGGIMHNHGSGGQIVWSLTDAEWRLDPARQALADAVIAEAEGRDDINVHVSIRLGGMLVFAADDAGLQYLMEKLPKDDRFPMRLNYHAAFHSPLLDHIGPIARAANPIQDFERGTIPLIDGAGRIWSPNAFDPAAIYDYTLGAQLNKTYDFSRAVQVAAAEFAPDAIILLGPGTTLGAPVAQALIASDWRELNSKTDFAARQATDPVLLSMGIEDQRALVVSQ
jgi:acyl transferase domain-containing protein